MGVGGKTPKTQMSEWLHLCYVKWKIDYKPKHIFKELEGETVNWEFNIQWKYFCKINFFRHIKAGENLNSSPTLQ